MNSANERLSTPPTADFIVPCYNEGENVVPFFEAFLKAFEEGESRFCWRLIMVDDGSKDDTWSCICTLAERDSRVAGIRFSRNFGKEAAIYAGLNAVDADYAGIIDADLQQPPATAYDMLCKLIADDEIDCVAAFQEQRREGFLVSWLKGRFYRVFAKASRSEVVAGASDFRVFRRQVVNAVLGMPEYYRFSKGIFSWVGFEVLPYAYTPDDRASGESKWSVRSLFRYAMEGLLSFTTSPLHFITKTGIAICILALLYAVVLIVGTLVMGIDLPGYASTVSLILLLGGGQFFALGVIGEYLARAYIQGKDRPVYIVKTKVNVHSDGEEEKR